MQSCATCQALMLEYLYDLLEEGERRTFQEHLATCSDCQAALARAQAQQRLLAAAARIEFPQVRFVAPTEEPAPVTQPVEAPVAILPFAARRRRVYRWVAAAAALLVAAGLGATVYQHGQEYTSAQSQVAQTERQVAELRQKQEETKQTLRAEDEQQRKTLADIAVRDRKRHLEVTAVQSDGLSPGAARQTIVEIRDFDNEPVDAKISPRVYDAQGKDKASPLYDIAKADQPGEEKAAQGKNAADRNASAEKRVQVEQLRKGTYRVTAPADLARRSARGIDLVLDAQRDGGAPAKVHVALPPATPTYITHLTTDKPIYQKGEVVHFRSLTLDRATLRPAQEDLCFLYSLTRPDGTEAFRSQGFNGILAREKDQGVKMVPGPDGKPVRGVGVGAHYLSPDERGGEWALTVREALGRFPPQTRKFLVNEYQKPQLNKKLDFNRSSYGPGDEVQALCQARRVDTDQPLARVPVTVEVLVDGKSYDRDGHISSQRSTQMTDEKGNVLVRFKLPTEIERGDATLGVTFGGSITETLVRPIPVVVNRLNVEFFPEGGDLVAGVENRVYFQVRTPLGKPADLRGELLEDGKPLNLTVATLHDDREPGVNQGMGRFRFTPTAGRRYELRIDAPAGISGRPTLPPVKADGVVLQVAESVVGAGKPVEVSVHAPRSRALVVGLYGRGRLLDSLSLQSGETRASLKPSGAAGVCRVTVFEEYAGSGTQRMLLPRAERLVYCRPAESVNLSFQPDRKSYVPGQKVKLGIEARTEKETLSGSVLMVAVVDRSALVLADDKTARTMPTHFLLTSEVRKAEDLEYADFLLGPQPKAAAALDLLLGTQGWRRFAEKGPLPVRDVGPRSETDRLVKTFGRSPDEPSAAARAEIEKAQQAHQQKVEQLQTEEAAIKEQEQQAQSDPTYLAALAQRDRYDRFLDGCRRLGPPILGVGLMVVALVCLGIALFRKTARALPAWTALVASAAGVLLIARTLPVNPTDPPGPTTVARNMEKSTSPNEERRAGHGTGADAKSDERELLKKTAATAANSGAFRGDAEMGPKLNEEQHQAAQTTAMPAPALPLTAPSAPGGFLPPGVPLNPLPPVPGMPRAATEGPPVPQAIPFGMAGGGGMAVPGANNFAPMAPGAQGMAPGADFGNGMQKAEQAMQAERFRQEALQLEAGKAPALGRPNAMAGGRGVGPARKPGALGQRARDMKRIDFNLELRRRFLKDGKQREKDLQALEPMIVREYAHTYIPPATGKMRSDYTEMLFWQPVLVLRDGKGSMSFDLSDSVTDFQVIAYAHTLDGRLGAATFDLPVRLPFSIQARTPQEVTASDKIDVAVTVANNTADGRTVRLTPTQKAGLKLLSAPKNSAFDLEPNVPLRQVYRFQPNIQEGKATVAFQGQAGPLSDEAAASFRIVPEGFPIVQAHSDVLEKSASETVTLPETWVEGTLHCRVQVYPSTLADLQQGLAALLREPCGCFEQTSSSNYPNLLVLDYLRETSQARPEIERQARELLNRGYDKLVAFECLNPALSKKQGYEWFGGTAPAHEALTAYGLMEFRDMARVRPVDKAMLARTEQYLLHQRDGKGGFVRNPRAIDSFGRAPDHITNAYIVWALTEGGKQEDLTRELDKLVEEAKTSKDPYFLALVANSLINRSQNEPARQLLRKIAGLQKEDGHLDAESTSITGSGGRDLQIETTALALLGWLKAQPGEFHGAVQKGVGWIGKQRGGYGGFGSTQSTILALKALIAYTRVNKKQAEAGELSLYIGDRRVAHRAFAAGRTDTLTLDVPMPEKELRPGRNKVRIEITGKNVFPYTLTTSYQTLKPPSAEGCRVRLNASLARSALKEGDVVRLTAEVENVSGKGQGMAVAILGLPGGLIVPEDMKQLKGLTRLPEDGSRPRVSAFEIRGRELVLYWRDLAPGQKVSVPIDLIARVPGEYRGPASRAYLYYNADRKHWIDPLRVTIAAQE